MSQPPYGPSSDPYGYPAQPPYSGQPYGPGYGYGPGAVPRTNGLAMTSMILGIIGIAICGLTSIPALICGHIAYNQIKRTGEEGKPMAVTGIVMGWIVTGIWLLLLLFWFGLAAGIATSD